MFFILKATSPEMMTFSYRNRFCSKMPDNLGIFVSSIKRNAVPCLPAVIHIVVVARDKLSEVYLSRASTRLSWPLKPKVTATKLHNTPAIIT